MSHMIIYGSGTKTDPWLLKTPSQSSEHSAWRDPESAPHWWLRSARGACPTECRPSMISPTCSRSVATGCRSAMPMRASPCRTGPSRHGPGQPTIRWGYYGLREGYRGRFANYVTPVLELLGMAELEHGARNNRALFRAG